MFLTPQSLITISAFEWIQPDKPSTGLPGHHPMTAGRSGLSVSCRSQRPTNFKEEADFGTAIFTKNINGYSNKSCYSHELLEKPIHWFDVNLLCESAIIVSDV